MSSLRLLIPLICYVAGTLVERYGNIPLWCGSLAVLTGVALMFLLKKLCQSPTGVIASVKWNWFGIALMFAGVGEISASLTPRADESLALRNQNFVQWRSSLMPEEKLYIDVSKVYTGEYGDVLKGTIADGGQWYGWGITSFCGAVSVSPGDLVSVPAKSVQGGYARDGEINVVLSFLERRVWSDRLHDVLVGAINGSEVTPQTRGLLLALIAGEGDAVDAAFRNAMADSGLAHILALSGMHVAIVAAFVMAFLWPLKLLGWWKLRLAFSVVVVWLFVIASGMADSTLRAAIMFTAASAAYLTERHRNATDALIVAAFIILLFSPDSVMNAGFQLSFLCVVALIAFVEPLNLIDRRMHPVLYKFVTLLLVPMVATVASWSLIGYYFGRIPLGFLPLNIVAVPLLPFYVGVAIVFILLSANGLHVDWMARLLDSAPAWLRSASEYIGTGTVIEVHLEVWHVFCWLSLLVLAWALMTARRTRRLQPDDEA